ncbi:hypothetical protein GCM10027037_02900 [Mucilaginibacter koreensis]
MKILFTLSLLAVSLTLFAQVHISGTVKNYKDSAFYINETGGFHNFTRVWRDNRVKVSIDKKHNFNVSVPEQAIGSWYVSTENNNQIFDLVKGESLNLIIDFSRQNIVHAIGRNAGDFNFSAFLSDSITKYKAQNNLSQKFRDKNLDSVLYYRKRLSSYKAGLLNKYRHTHIMSDTYYRWLRAQYLYEPYERTLVENVTNKDSLDKNTISKFLENGVSDDYAALNTSEYNDLVDFYINSKIKSKAAKLTLGDHFNYVANSNVLSGSTKDVYLSRFMAWLIKQPDSVYNPIFEKYNRIVHRKELKQSVISRRYDYQTPKVAPAFVANTSKLNSITNIFKKYKGSIIYIDFWASWCIPCRAEMPNSESLKEKLKGKKVVFLYFGYNDKERAWLKARNQLDIQGEHYLLSDNMIKEANELFGINGIPHYAIIDKEGNIINKNAKRPRDMYQELLTLSSN